MSRQYRFSCLVIVSCVNLLYAVVISQQPWILSTYKPSTLHLPSGFDSQVAPRQPMLYPYAGGMSGSTTRPTIRKLLHTTPGWFPLTVNTKHYLPLMPTSFSTLTSTLKTRPVPALSDRISHDSKYSLSSSNNGPVFESIIYGTWKPNPPFQPVEILNGIKQQQQQYSDRPSNSRNNNSSLVVDKQFYNRTINRQNGGFIGIIQQKPTKANRYNIQNHTFEKLVPNSSSMEYKSNEFMETNLKQKQRKIKKRGRQKIRPISRTAEQTAIEIDSIRDSSIMTTTTTTTTTTTEAAPIVIKETIQRQQNVIKVNSTDPILMEVVKEINESTETKYNNHKQTSTYSISMMLNHQSMTTDYHNEDDYNNGEIGDMKSQSATISSVSLSTEFQRNNNADDDIGFKKINATRRSWPIDFMNTPLTTTDGIRRHMNNLDSAETSAGVNIESDITDIPLELSALNISSSLWPKLPGNITKLGSPYESKSSAEETALCVPITVQEQNILNKFVYIERVFCFPMSLSTTSEYSLDEGRSGGTTTITTKSFTKTKVQNFNDFVDLNYNHKATNNARHNFRNNLYLLMFISLINYKTIV